MKQEQLDQWQEKFQETADRLAKDLLQEAKRNAKTYRDASTYIKQISQQAFGDITDPLNRTSRKIVGAVCDLALYQLHEEERDLPIKEG